MTGLFRPTRRGFGAWSLATGASLAAPAVKAQTRRLSVVVSAIYKRSFDRFVVPRMREMHGVEVVSSALLSAEALARGIAQRSSPQISLFTLDQGPWLQGKDLGLWAKFDPALVTSTRTIPAGFQDPDGHGAALFSMLTGLCYDEQALRAARAPIPESFFDMWAAPYRDRVAMPQFTNTFAFITLAYANRLLGGTDTDGFGRGFAKMRELKPNIRTFIGPLGQLIQLFQQKEIWIAFAPQLSALQASAAGLPIKWAAPKEGAVALSHFIGIPENAPNMEDAQKLANVMLAPQYQKELAETDFMVPVNTATQLSEAFKASFPVTMEMTQAAAQVPWAEYNRTRVQLAERWQREIQS